MWQQVRADNLTVCYCKKQKDLSFSCICPAIDHESCYNIVNLAVDPQGDSRVDLQTIKFSAHNGTETRKTDVNKYIHKFMGKFQKIYYLGETSMKASITV